MKLGKTTFASLFPKNLFLATELGLNSISGCKYVPILKWTDIKNVLRELKQPQARELYDTITIDTLNLAITLCEDYICQRENVSTIKDIPWGQGFRMVARELQETLRLITLYGYGLILITHEKTKATGLTDSDGNAIVSVEPDLGNRNEANVISAICDLIAYIGVEPDEKGRLKRWLYTRQTPTIFAGSRWPYLDEKIPFSYEELVNAIDRAIQKQKENGAVVVNESIQFNIEKSRPFKEVLQDAKNIWTSYLDGASDEDEKDHRLIIMKDAVKNIFGNENFKLSQAAPSQVDLIELFITEMKDVIDQEN